MAEVEDGSPQVPIMSLADRIGLLVKTNLENNKENIEHFHIRYPFINSQSVDVPSIEPMDRNHQRLRSCSVTKLKHRFEPKKPQQKAIENLKQLSRQSSAESSAENSVVMNQSVPFLKFFGQVAAQSSPRTSSPVENIDSPDISTFDYSKHQKQSRKRRMVEHKYMKYFGSRTLSDYDIIQCAKSFSMQVDEEEMSLNTSELSARKRNSLLDGIFEEIHNRLTEKDKSNVLAKFERIYGEVMEVFNFEEDLKKRLGTMAQSLSPYYLTFSVNIRRFARTTCTHVLLLF